MIYHPRKSASKPNRDRRPSFRDLWVLRSRVLVVLVGLGVRLWVGFLSPSERDGPNVSQIRLGT